MKIMLINDFGYSLGGAETYFFKLRDALIQRGHQVLCVSSDRRRSGTEQFLSDVQLSHSGNFFNLDSYFNLKNYFQLKSLLHEQCPDVVHLHNIFYTLSPSILYALKHCSTVLTFHDYFSICARDKTLPGGRICAQPFGSACRQNKCICGADYFKASIKRKLIKRGLQSIARGVAPSEYVRQELQRNDINNVDVLVHPITAPLAPGLEWDSSSNTILYLGRLAKQKGLDVLFEAFREAAEEVPAAELVIAGRGEEEQRLREKADQSGLGSRVKFAGWLDESEKSKAIAHSLCLVVPSVWPEVAGLTMYEAAAQGVPSIASNIGGIPEFVIDGETGLLFEAGDAKGLARKIVYVLQDKDAASQLGHNSKERARMFSMDAHLDRLEELYRVVAK